jgi:hypothetical protein
MTLPKLNYKTIFKRKINRRLLTNIKDEVEKRLEPKNFMIWQIFNLNWLHRI